MKHLRAVVLIVLACSAWSCRTVTEPPHARGTRAPAWFDQPSPWPGMEFVDRFFLELCNTGGVRATFDTRPWEFLEEPPLSMTVAGVPVSATLGTDGAYDAVILLGGDCVAPGERVAELWEAALDHDVWRPAPDANRRGGGGLGVRKPGPTPSVAYFIVLNFDKLLIAAGETENPYGRLVAREVYALLREGGAVPFTARSPEGRVLRGTLELTPDAIGALDEVFGPVRRRGDGSRWTTESSCVSRNGAGPTRIDPGSTT